jgi:hypothetical protein
LLLLLLLVNQVFPLPQLDLLSFALIPLERGVTMTRGSRAWHPAINFGTEWCQRTTERTRAMFQFVLQA